MKLLFTTVLALNILIGNNVLAGRGSDESKKSIAFTENKGQVHDQNYKARPDVLFGAMTGNMAFHLKSTGVSYQLYRTDSYKEVEDAKTKEKRKEIDKETIYRIDLNWLNVNKNFDKVTDEVLPGYNNYYLESCPNGALQVKSYTGVTLKNLYNGVNLHYYQKNGELKHDYIVAPHANYKQIQIKVEGAQVTLSNNGSLILSTPLGKVQEAAPIVYQNGRELKSKWLVNNNTLSFEVENYDPNYELVIDPVTRIWGTFYGGTANEVGASCSTDASGNVYLTGNSQTSTSTLIATVGSHQSTHSGNRDGFLVKFNSAGVRQWGTYYGGMLEDRGESCATDAAGNIFMCGYSSTGTTTLVATALAHQSVQAGGNDAFLVKFNSSGIRQWGTYYGGTGDDRGYSCAVDGLGDIYMTGICGAATGTIISTAGAHQLTHAGAFDGFVVKFNTSGVRQWGTFYGGSSFDEAWGCAADFAGNVYITGYTQSGTGIATAGAHQTIYNGTDAFLVKFNSSGVRQWGTYYGGLSTVDWARSCAADPAGNVYMAGETVSTSSIATLGAHQTTLGGGGNDGFLVKFNGVGVRQWGTYYGGSSTDQGMSCRVNSTGDIYLAGISTSTSGISTPSSYQVAYGGGSEDAFVAKFNTSGVRQWGTYYGGIGDGKGNSCAADQNGNVFLAGTTSSSGTVIASAGSHQSNSGGSDDAFLVKFNTCDILNPVASVNNNICSGASLNFTATITGTSTPTYSWSGPSSFTSSLQNPIISNASTSHVGIYTLTVNSGGCIETTTTQVSTVNPSPTITVNSGSICSGKSFTINPNGASTYTIQGGNSVVSPTANATYTVVGTSTAGCVSTNTAISSVTVNNLPSISVNSGVICSGKVFTMTPSGGVSYTYSSGSNTVSPLNTTSFTVTGSSAVGCTNTAVSNVTVNTTPTISAAGGFVCPGGSFTMNPSGANTYTYLPAGPIVTPVATTNYTIAGSSAQGCTATPIVITVTYTNSLVVSVTGTNVTCAGSPIVLTANGASTYSWSTGATTSTISVTPTANITYTVLGTSSTCSNTSSHQVTVNPTPTITALTSNSVLCPGETATITASGATSYSWNTSSTAASIVVSPTANTTYTVTGTGSNGCSNTAVITQSTSTCTGINEVSMINQINLFPNPNTGKFTLIANSDYKLEVINIIGQILYSSHIGQGNNNINISNQASGIYFVKLSNGTEARTIKFIIE